MGYSDETRLNMDRNERKEVRYTLKEEKKNKRDEQNKSDGGNRCLPTRHPTYP
jgi:hypothetical protein